MRRHLSTLALAALAALAVPARAGTPAPGFTDTLVFGGLNTPTATAFLPDGKLLITEKGGNLDLFDGSSTTTLITIPVCTGSEMGLLGVAINPNFSANGFIYLYRTKAGAGGCGTSTGRFNQVVQATMSGGSVTLGSLVELLSGIATDNGNHDGGVLRIGPVDQKLYVGAGDSGNGDNQGGPGSSTNAATSTVTMTPIATAALPTCVGDCHGHHQVTVDEIVTMVNIALGNAPLLNCEAADANHDGQVTIDEILTAVNNALNGCVQGP